MKISEQVWHELNPSGECPWIKAVLPDGKDYIVCDSPAGWDVSMGYWPQSSKAICAVPEMMDALEKIVSMAGNCSDGCSKANIRFIAELAKAALEKANDKDA